MKDPALTSILSYDNYQKDGPEFVDSLAYLKKTSEEFNAQINSLLEKLDEDNICSYINDKESDTYYRQLYVDLMMNDSMKKDFKETQELLKETQTRVNLIVNTSTDVLNYLVNQKEYWKLEDGEIKFQNEGLYNQYNAYIAKMNLNKSEK